MNKVIVVTGGTKGIGLAVIENFASRQFDIITCSRNAKELEALKELVEGKYPVKVMTKATDMGDKIQVNAFADFILGFGRPVDVLVNNAGFFMPGEISTEPDGALESMMNANLYSAYNLSRCLIGGMKER
ncbi:MAG TPA: SDR family NAD(P)-dependent oxidoreductase, partial [Chryseolinea sp.]|nr:SDR family NAD(P)-dependent oxidoreductase [Chryseolinea sp.]